MRRTIAQGCCCVFIACLITACFEEQAIKNSSQLTIADEALDEASLATRVFLREQLGASYDLVLPAASPHQIEQGKHIFAQHCSGCHGVGGAGDGVLSRQLRLRIPNFAHPQSAYRYSEQGRLYIIKHGLAELGVQMMGFKDFLSDDEVFAVYSYVKSLIQE